jgi:sugar lactone lactonase YvrE
VTFDANGDRFFVMDSDPRAGFFNEGAVPSHASVVQVDRRTGNRRLISAQGTGTGTLLPWGTSAAIHPSGMILATTNRMGILRNGAESGSIIEIDPASGNRRVVSGATETNETVGTGPILDSAMQLIVESETHALVLQRNKMARVHLTSGNRTIISGPDGMDVQGSGPALVDAMGFVLDRRAEPPIAYVAARGMVVEVDLGNGNRRIVSDDANASLGPGLANAGGIALDNDRERVIVMTPELFRQRDVYVSVSLEDGTRQFLSAEDEASRASGFEDDSAMYSIASGLFFDDEARVLWAVDWSLRSLQALDADTGEAVLFSHFGR